MKVLEKNCKAFKEWAVIVDALGRGRQSLVVRKGGIHEGMGGFGIEGREFFLFPTYEHQNREELIPEVHPRLDELVLSRPRDGQVHLSYYATLQASYKVTDPDCLQRLESHHVWTPSVIRERFEWGKDPGLHVLVLRVFRLAAEAVIPYKEEYGGCKSWVDFQVNLATAGDPVLSGHDFHRELHAIEKLLV